MRRGHRAPLCVSSVPGSRYRVEDPHSMPAAGFNRPIFRLWSRDLTSPTVHKQFAPPTDSGLHLGHGVVILRYNAIAYILDSRAGGRINQYKDVVLPVSATPCYRKHPIGRLSFIMALPMPVW